MHHTAHHAIKTRLTMWQQFFAAGIDSTPDSADDAEYGLDALIDLAREGNNSDLHQLATRVEEMERSFMLKLDDAHAARLLSKDRYAAAMMRDDITVPAVTMAELDAVLAAH